MLLSKLGLCVFRRLSGRMSMIDLFAYLVAQHPTCHWCLSVLCWWVRCSCPLLPAISSCGHGLLVCACVGLAGGLVWFAWFFVFSPFLLGLCGLLGGLRPFVSLVWSCWHLLRRLPFTSWRSTWGPFTSQSTHTSSHFQTHPARQIRQIQGCRQIGRRALACFAPQGTDQS